MERILHIKSSVHTHPHRYKPTWQKVNRCSFCLCCRKKLCILFLIHKLNVEDIVCTYGVPKPLARVKRILFFLISSPFFSISSFSFFLLLLLNLSPPMRKVLGAASLILHLDLPCWLAVFQKQWTCCSKTLYIISVMHCGLYFAVCWVLWPWFSKPCKNISEVKCTLRCFAEFGTQVLSTL